MYYFDEIDFIDESTLPAKDDVKGVTFKNDLIFLELKDGSEFNIVTVLESLTKNEFNQIAHYILSKLK